MRLQMLHIKNCGIQVKHDLEGGLRLVILNIRKEKG